MTDQKRTGSDSDTTEETALTGAGERRDESTEQQADLLQDAGEHGHESSAADESDAVLTQSATDDSDQQQAAQTGPEDEPDASREADSGSPDEAAASPEPPAPAAPAVKAKGRGLAALALLLALAAAGGVGYLYYLLVYMDPMAQVKAETETVGEQLESFSGRLTDQVQNARQQSLDAIETLRQEQAERLAANEKAVAKSLNEALQAAPPSQREWKLAEAEYLLRIANHRVLMEGDSEGALNLLLAADQILADLDDFALHQVRARLADEIIALKQVRRDDLQGIYLRLEAVKTGVGRLPLLTPELVPPAPPQTDELTIWQVMGAQIKDLIRIRDVRADEAIKPLLAPDEFRYLELNLRLALEQAQLATLKRQQDVFEQSLNNVGAWLQAHADLEHEATQALLEEVAALSTIHLARPLPDVSGSLNELLDARRGGS